MGRPSKYKTEFVKQAFKLAELGATDKQIADFFNVTEQTLNNWKEKHPNFFESLKAGKQSIDDAVERSLFQRALGGYTLRETKRRYAVTVDEDGNESRTQSAEEVIEKNIGPDTTACIFWLKNRRPDDWRDKREIGGDPDNPLTVMYRAWAEALDADGSTD